MSSIDAEFFQTLQSQAAVSGYRTKTGFNFSDLYFNEKYYFNDQFVEDKLKWFGENRLIGLYISLAYLVAIFALHKLMAARPTPYKLRVLLVGWNIALAFFSIFGTVRMWPEMIYSIRTKGLEYSICNSDHVYGVAGHWSYLFVLSKIPELFDTVFIVLRKQPLIFLHYYHHSTILAYVWYFYPEGSSSNRWFGAMNYFVHSIMYTYYALKAMRFHVPKRISALITGLQLTQMVIGLLICFYILDKKSKETDVRKCNTSVENINYSLLMYLSYFALFFKFFLDSYFVNKNRQLQKKQQQQQLEKKAE